QEIVVHLDPRIALKGLIRRAFKFQFEPGMIGQVKRKSDGVCDHPKAFPFPVGNFFGAGLDLDFIIRGNDVVVLNVNGHYVRPGFLKNLRNGSFRKEAADGQLGINAVDGSFGFNPVDGCFGLDAVDGSFGIDAVVGVINHFVTAVKSVHDG
ncbi:MAG: hypothetical protein IJK97_08425, partial [Thermoguttaceae bacterium]|nr:hypothetical protein [Thermoguttaceae bacterium]